MTMNNTEKTIDTVWVLDDRNRLLSRGGLVFRYSPAGKANADGWAPIRWEKLLQSGTFVEVGDADQTKMLDNVLRVRLAMLEDPEARDRLRR